MNEKTQQFLAECKKAGYERVAIFVRDKRVPQTTKFKSGVWFGDEPRPQDLPNTPINVVCGYPEQLGEHFIYPGSDWPKMWTIVKECELVAGLQFGGFGLGDAHNVRPHLRDALTKGYYDLLAQPQADGKG